MLTTLGIIFALSSMNAPINLNNQAMFGAVEISNERSKRMLATKLQSVQLATAQMIPEQFFRWGHRFAQLPGTLFDIL
jgi:hypothetical protein